MRQCPDCEEKDRVVIAGKVFCANCGTPWAPVNTAEEQPYLTKIGLNAVPAQAAAPVAASAQTAPPAPSPTPTPAPAAPPIQAPAAAPVVPPPPAAPAPMPAPAPPIPPMPAPAPAPASPAMPPAAPEVPSVQAPAPASPPAPAVPPAVPVPPAPTVPAQNLKEQIGSEIPSLDGKSETVFSDAEFKQLSQAQTPPPPASVSVPTVNAPVPVSTLAPKTQPTGAPAIQVDGIARPTPISQIAVPSVPTATTMTPEDAFKLALATDVKPPAPSAAPASNGPARPIALVMSVIAVSLLGAYLWQSNYSSFALKLAGVRSGMSATVPSYIPSGWKVNNDISASQGSLDYTLASREHSMNINQKKTDWDSQAVLEQFVLPRSNGYLALQAQGLTIYVFGDNEAAWVNHGTFYHLSGQHGLSQEDIIRISTSL